MEEVTLSPSVTPIRAEELSTCISCGLCLNDCPTFRVLGDEADSPRGRIALMRTLVATTGTPDASLVEHLDACLVCRACETACPSGVPFGRLMEGAREIVEERTRRSFRERLALRVGLGVISHPARLGIVTALLGIYQRSGLRGLARRLRLVPAKLRDAEALVPDRIAQPYALRDEPAIGNERHMVAFFAGCVMRTAFVGGANSSGEKSFTNGESSIVARAGTSSFSSPRICVFKISSSSFKQRATQRPSATK